MNNQKIVRLSEVGTTFGGLTGKSKADFGHGDAQYVTFVEVMESARLRGRSLNRVVTTKSEKQAEVRHGDVLFNGSSETPEEVALGAYVDFDVPPRVHLNSFCFGFRVFKDGFVDPKFLAYFSRSGEGRRIVSSLAQGATRYNISKTKLLQTPLAVPSYPEQRSIAAALTDCDDLIQGLELLIMKKRNVKQGMMQELLTGRTRFPGFTGEWEKTEIRFLATVIGGGTPPTRTPSYWGGGIPWFTPAEIDPAGSGLISHSERTITANGLANSSATLLPTGSVLLTSRASLGNCAVAEIPVSTNQGFASMVPKDLRSTWFLYYWIQQNQSELESRAAGSTFLEISATKVATIPLLTPNIDEQQAIGAALKDADAEIQALERRLESARAVKVGMMQELLTGRTRLPVKEEA